MRLFEKHWDHLGKYSQMRRSRSYLMDGAIGSDAAEDRLDYMAASHSKSTADFSAWSIYALPFPAVCFRLFQNTGKRSRTDGFTGSSDDLFYQGLPNCNLTLCNFFAVKTIPSILTNFCR